jgi:hypothetical protein
MNLDSPINPTAPSSIPTLKDFLAQSELKFNLDLIQDADKLVNRDMLIKKLKGFADRACLNNIKSKAIENMRDGLIEYM